VYQAGFSRMFLAEEKEGREEDRTEYERKKGRPEKQT
jgi:hypothetical protein